MSTKNVISCRSAYTYWLNKNIDTLGKQARVDSDMSLSDYKTFVFNVIYQARDTSYKKNFINNINAMCTKTSIYNYICNSCDRARKTVAKH